MPRRTDLHRVLLLGSGPIVIGQAAEFDYSGTQAVKALKEEGYTVVLVNSNPATIMTDPELADRTYIEPVTPDWVRKVIERESPDALLPTMGGQTALNVAMALVQDGTLERFGVELIGANARAIQIAEDGRRSAPAFDASGLQRRWAAPWRPWRMRSRPWARPGSRRSFDRRTRWVAPVAAWPTTAPSSRSWSSERSSCRRCTRHSSSAACSDGRSSSSRSCATAATTW